jgi:hypothetical protein
MDNKKSSEIGWCKLEFADANLGDKRLNIRLLKLAQQLSNQPLSSINQACEDWAATKAAYRFFDNQTVEAAEILSPHQKRTQERMLAHKIVLAVQDTTELDYTLHPKTEGLGPIGNHNKDSLGLLLHTSLIFSVEQLPLGILSQQIWSRPEQSRQQEYEHKRVPIADKESNKWLKAIEETQQKTPPGVEVITVGDREADLYEFLLRAEQLQAKYVIRATHDRRLKDEAICLWEKLSKKRVRGEIEVEVSATDKQKSRTARLKVRYAKIKLKPPQRLKSLRIEGWKPVELWAVFVKEVNPPKAVEPLEWMLLTDVEVGSFEQAVERVSWYTVRFHIEMYHKVLKSGCKVEAARFGNGERIKRYVALMSIVAWRLFWMTFLNRERPDEACTTMLAEHEWKALYCRIQRKNELPKEVPTVREAVRWIAKLGGFLGRKGDEEPGITTIWRGWQRLTDIAEDWLIFHTG